MAKAKEEQRIFA